MQNKLTAVLLSMVALVSCVQKTTRKTVVFSVHVTDDATKSIGVRGNDKPLTWERDSVLRLTGPGTYGTAITYNTGYKFTEVKFTQNGEFELGNEANRRILFAEQDTTFYEATFNKMQ